MRKFVCLLFVAIVLSATVNAAKVIVKAKLDSAVLLMGKTTALHLEIAQDKNVIGHFTNEKSDTLNARVEIAGWSKGDTTDLDNNRIQINKDLIIQSFDSGMYVIPALKFVVGKDTFSTNVLSLKVLPVKVDSLKTVHDFKPVEEATFHFFDWIPTFITDYWWIYLIIVLLSGIGLLVYFKWIKKGKLPLISKETIALPPYEEAIQNLTQLKERHLWESGQEKEYFTQLTDILRTYIDRRFDINAMEMTSGQIVDILKKNEEARLVNDQLKQILDVADFVKFAKMRPMPEDNEASYQRALTFINETKPVEKPDSEADVKQGGIEINGKKETNKKEKGIK